MEKPIQQQQEAYTQPILKIIINRRQFDLPADVASGEKQKNIKLIFIGQVPDATNRILRKLELGQQLTKPEETELNNQFPYFKTKVGGLDPEEFHVHFINQTIPNNANTAQLELLVLDLLYGLGYLTTLKQVKQGLVLYGFPRVLPYSYIYDVLEYLYQDTTVLLTGEQIARQLVNKLIAPRSSYAGPDSETDNLLKHLKLSAKVAYTPLELSNNADFQKLVRQIPVVFAPRRYKKTVFENLYVSNDIYMFEGLQVFTDCTGTNTLAELQTQLKESVKYSTPDITEYTQIDNTAFDDIINFAGLTANNTIQVYLGTDIHTWFESLPQSAGRSNNFMTFMQTFLQRTQKFATLEDFTIAVINNRRNFRVSNTTGIWTQPTLDKLAIMQGWNDLSNSVRNGLCTQSVLDITGIKCKNFIFDCYDMGIKTHINLKTLFQDIETNYYLPLCKYVSDRETQLYNIYKPFFRNLDERILNIFLRGKDRIMLFNEEILATSGKANIRRLKQLINWDYIVFKWRVDDENLVNIYLFENGYIITEYQTAHTTDVGQYIDQHRVLGYMKLLTKIISKIKDKYKLSELSLPNPEKILKTTPANIEYSHLINIGLKYEFGFSNRLLWAWTKLHAGTNIANKYDKMEDWVRAKGYNSVYDGVIASGFIKKLNKALSNQPNLFVRHKYDEEINFIYTSFFGFYSRDNAKYFMRTYLKDHGDRVSNTEKEKMFALVSRIFKITLDECQNVFQDIQSIELQTKYSFLYPVVECRLKLMRSEHKLVLTIDNISQYNMSAVILGQLDTLIKDVVLGIQQTANLDVLLNNMEGIRNITCASAVDEIDKKGAKEALGKVADDTNIQADKILGKHARATIDELLELDMNGNLGADINLDNINFGGLDMGMNMGGLEIDLDMDAIEKLILIESEPPQTTAENAKDAADVAAGKGNKSKSVADKQGVQEEGLQDIKLKQFVGSKGKLTVVAYMQEMRKLYDPDLYEPVVKGKTSDYNYEHDDCPDTPKRQPFIITKDKLKEIDPESVTGYMRYNNNYYVCPRIWDARAGMPISARKFIENGLKSPYTGGLPILQSPKNEISDKYSVIIRKPTTNPYWSDPSLHQDWPELLKNTEKDAYPGLKHGKKHPNKVCVPCCFKHKPDDTDTNKDELRQFLKVSGSATCQYHGEPESYPGAGDNPGAAMVQIKKGDGPVETYCKNEEYISSAGTRLKNCRLGLLPEELNILLNNSQELFLRQNDSMIDNNANFFLRRGINENHVTNILDSFSAIFEMKLERLLNIIYNKLTPMDFIELNNGELIDIFCSSTTYPIDSKDRDKFIKFITGYPDLSEYLNIDVGDILTNLENREINLTKVKTGYDAAKHQITTNTKLLYRIYSGYYNYLAYLVSPNEIKNYKYIIQIFSRPRKWLIKQGANIIIFDKTSSQIKCLDNFNYKTDRLIILIEEAPDYFVPVFHIQSKYNQIQPPIGIIKLDDTLNLTDSFAASLAKKRPIQQKLIDATKDRLTSIIRLLYVQAGLCNYNMSYYHAKLIKTIKTIKVGLITQYLGLGENTQAQYLRIGTSERNSIFIPIYPHFLERHVTVSDFYGLATDMHRLQFTLNKLANNLYPTIGSGNVATKDGAVVEKEPYELMAILDLGYHISEIIVEREYASGGKERRVLVTGVRFANDLEMPLLPQEFKSKEISGIISRISGARSDGITATVSTKPIINLLKLLSAPTALAQASFNIHALLNLLLHQTKNNLSYYISGVGHLVGKQTEHQSIQQLIGFIYNPNETARDETLFYTVLDDVLQQIIKVDKETLAEYIRNYFTDRKTGKSRLLDKAYTRKVVDLICRKTTRAGKANPDAGGVIDTKNPASQLCIREALGTHSKTRIRMAPEIYEYILMSVGKDLINNKIEADAIVKGRYIIPTDDLISSRVSNTIYNPTQDFQQNLIISPAEMSYYVAHNLISKYRRNFKLKNPSAAIELGKESQLAGKDLDVLSSIVIKDVKNRLVSGLSSIFSYISSSSKSSEAGPSIQIKTTVFNSEGILNPHARHAPCVFPYKSSGRLNYHCGTAKDVLNGNKRRLVQQGLKDTDLICPTEINSDKTVTNWGYCPAVPNASMTRLGQPGKITDAYQYESRNVLKKVGNCDFPFIYSNRKIVNPLSRAKPFISVNFKCGAQGDAAPIQNGTWCYVGNSMAPDVKTKSISNSSETNSPGTNKTGSKDEMSGDDSDIPSDINPDILEKSPGMRVSLLIGAAKGETVYKGDWTLGDLVNPESGVPEIKDFAAKWERITGKNPVICEIAQDDTKREKIEKGLGLDKVTLIQPDSYNPDYCTLSESKKGYKKEQLYLFGRDVLGINYKSMLKESNTIMKKEELCELINQKIRDIKKAEILAAAGTMDPEKLKELQQNIYTKDPVMCLKGPTKGGYKLTELRDMAITYFGLSQVDADKLDKQGLCSHITKAIGLAIKFDGSETASGEELGFTENEIYPADRNIELCARPTSRGGLSSNDLKKIAGTKLGIDITGKSKEQLCQLIKQKMIEIANAPPAEEFTRTNSVTDELHAVRVDEAKKSEKDTGLIGELPITDVDKINL